MDRRRIVQAGFAVFTVIVGTRAVIGNNSSNKQQQAGCISPAMACSCANQQPPTVQPYGRDVVRPRNARLRLSPIWHLPGREDYDKWARDNGFDGTKWNLELRAKDDPKAPAIATEQRIVGDAAERMLEIWPKDGQPLDPKKTYVLEPDNAVGKEKTPWRTRAEITTSDRIDSKPPSWAGATGARLLPTGRADTSSCAVANPLIEIDVQPPSDDDTPAEEIVIGVWRGGSVSESLPPTTISRIYRGQIHLGRGGYCSDEDFHVTVERVELTLRAIDLAGNLSAPNKVVVDPAAPSPPEPSAAPPRGGCSRACGKTR